MLLFSLLVAVSTSVIGQWNSANSLREKARSLLKRWCWEIGRVRSLCMHSSTNSLFKQLIAVILSWVWISCIAGFSRHSALGLTILALELAFLFSHMIIFSVFNVSVEYTSMVRNMTAIYLCNALIVALPAILDAIHYEPMTPIQPLPLEVLVVISLVHVSVMVITIRKFINQRKHIVLLSDIDKCILVNLNADDENPLNSSEGSQTGINNVSHYLIQSGSKVQLIAVTRVVGFEEIKKGVSSAATSQQQSPSLVPIIPGATGAVSAANNVSVNIDSIIDKFQGGNGNKASGGLLQQPTSPTEVMRKKSTSIAERSQLMGMSTSNPMSTTALRSHVTSTKNIVSESNKGSAAATAAGSMKVNSSINFGGEGCSRQEFAVEILNTMELKQKNEEDGVLMTFDEKTQRMVVSNKTSVHFYAVPSFKKVKVVLLDANSQYVMHATQPYCLQYHSEEYIEFARLDLGKEKITKEDVKYQSFAFQNPCPANGFLFFGSFASSDSSTAVETVFLRDGQNLVAVSLNNLSIETYSGKLPKDASVAVSIEQLNCRQIVLNTGEIGSTAGLQKLVLDIPTNMCCRVLTQFPIATEFVSIKNLQNQIIVNIPNSSMSACVYDLDTKELMELPKSVKVSSAWCVNENLYVIDETKEIKVFSFHNSKFNLVPAGENGLCCVSLALN